LIGCHAAEIDADFVAFLIGARFEAPSVSPLPRPGPMARVARSVT
jgi:hypothetical protein